MEAPKLILLNGPRLCGKNAAVAHIKEVMSVPIIDSRCKDHLFTLTQQFFCLTESEFYSHYNDRETKETPKKVFAVSARAYNALAPIIGTPNINPGLLDQDVKLSVREALIYVSEVICKPTFGREYLGTARANTLSLLSSGECAVDDSCGFDDEIPPTIRQLGMGNILLIRIHGRGSFDGDSRRFISDGVVTNTIDINNDGTEQSFLQRVGEVAVTFYDKG
jgi:hypothetical protein